MHAHPLRRLTLLALGFLLVPLSASESEPFRLYRLGNSHTNSIRHEFIGLIGAAGHRNVVHDQHTVPGAPIRWLWGKSPGTSKEDLENKHWDAVIFQTYNSTNQAEKDAIAGYTELARKANPDVRVILYTIWPDPDYTLLPGDEWFPEGLDFGRSERWTEEVAADLRERFPDLDVAVAPTSLVIRMVGGMADAGLIPNLTGYNDLTQDVGHMGLYGGYAIGCTKTAMLFGESPIGYSAQMLKEQNGGGYSDEVTMEVDPEAALAIQHVVWDILAEYQLDGLDTGLWINSGRMVPALQGKAYDRAVPVVNAQGPVSIELVAGELPAGLQLQAGRISGTPSATGVSTLTLRASDGSTTVERTILLPVEREMPLEVAPVERSLQADQYILDDLVATGAIGKASWELVGGELPNGIALLESGLIKGTPAEEGSFTATVRASDRHPEGARQAEGTLTFHVAEPSAGTIRVPVIDQELSVRDPLAEQDLSVIELDQVITDAEGTEVARFGVAAYRGDAKFQEKRPGKFAYLYLLVEIAAEHAGDFPLESLHWYIDANHTREVIYNEDDEHWMVPRNGRYEQVAGYRPKRMARAQQSVNDDGSWTVLMTHSMLSGFGVHVLTTPVTYGMDVAVGSRKDPEQRYYWRGNATSDKNTSVFGSVLIPDTTSN